MVSSISFNDFYFFFNDPATTEIYTLSLHDALPISAGRDRNARRRRRHGRARRNRTSETSARSEEHTSELQSRQYLVCRVLLDKKRAYWGRRKCIRRVVIYKWSAPIANSS